MSLYKNLALIVIDAKSRLIANLEQDDKRFSILNEKIKFCQFSENFQDKFIDKKVRLVIQAFTNKHYIPHKNTRAVKKSFRLFDLITIQNGTSVMKKYLNGYNIEYIDSFPYMIGGYLYIGYILEHEETVFIAFVGGQTGDISFFYFPALLKCLLVNQTGDAKRAHSLIPNLLMDIMQYLRMSNEIKSDSISDELITVLCEGTNAHLGTALVSDYAALEYFLENNIHLNQTIIAHFNQGFVNRDLFSKHFKNQIFLDNPININNWLKIENSKFVFVRPTLNYVVPHNFARRINITDVKKNNDTIYILINIRTHTRTCNFTIEDFFILHKKLKYKFKKIFYYFDGLTKLVSRPLNKKEKSWEASEINLYNSIAEYSKNEFLYEITVGLSLEEKIHKFSACDIAIITYGSGFLYPYMLKLKTIMLSSFSHSLNNKIIKERDGGISEEFEIIFLSPKNPSPEERKKLPADTSLIIDNSTLLSYGLYNENYYIDFNIVGEAALKLLSSH